MQRFFETLYPKSIPHTSTDKAISHIGPPYSLIYHHTIFAPRDLLGNDVLKRLSDVSITIRSSGKRFKKLTLAKQILLIKCDLID